MKCGAGTETSTIRVPSLGDRTGTFQRSRRVRLVETGDLLPTVVYFMQHAPFLFHPGLGTVILTT